MLDRLGGGLYLLIFIGTGVELRYLSLISTVLGLGVASLIFHLLLSDQPVAGKTPQNRRSLWIWPGLACPSTAPDDIWYAAGFLLFSAGGGALIAYARVRGRDELFLPCLAAAYVRAMLAALCLAPSTRHTCPRGDRHAAERRERLLRSSREGLREALGVRDQLVRLQRARPLRHPRQGRANGQVPELSRPPDARLTPSLRYTGLFEIGQVPPELPANLCWPPSRCPPGSLLP